MRKQFLPLPSRRSGWDGACAGQHDIRNMMTYGGKCPVGALQVRFGPSRGEARCDAIRTSSLNQSARSVLSLVILWSLVLIPPLSTVDELALE